MHLVDADELIMFLRYNDVVVYSTPEGTIMEFLDGAAPVACDTCKWWNRTRMDDWGCCESEEMSATLNFTTQMSAQFGCAFYQRTEHVGGKRAVSIIIDDVEIPYPMDEEMKKKILEWYRQTGAS